MLTVDFGVVDFLFH